MSEISFKDLAAGLRGWVRERAGLSGTWRRRMRRERKAAEAATPDVPGNPGIEASAMTGALAPLRDRLAQALPVPPDREVLREFLRCTPHQYAPADEPLDWACVCGLPLIHEVHDSDSRLDTWPFLDGTGGLRERMARGTARAMAEAAQTAAATPPEPEPEPEPEAPVPMPPSLSDALEQLAAPVPSAWARQWREQEHAARAEPAQPGPAAAAAGVIGHLVAFSGDGRLRGTTHTTPLTLEEARREARAHGYSTVRRYFPVELREVPDD